MKSYEKKQHMRRSVPGPGLASIYAPSVSFSPTMQHFVAFLWQRSVRETRRAEAAGLLSQAQLEMDSYPSAAVAYATASLELSDSEDARLLALEALWKGPTAFVANEDRTWMGQFTPAPILALGRCVRT